MGVLNVTPDSFSDGGHFLSAKRVEMARAGRRRRRPHRHRRRIDASRRGSRDGKKSARDSRHGEARAPARAGLDRHGTPAVMGLPSRRRRLINDVSALRDGRAGGGGCVGRRLPDAHAGRAANDAERSRGTTTWSAKCGNFCANALRPAWRRASRRAAVIDPGFGFGKRSSTISRSCAGCRNWRRGLPVLAGLSRKPMIGALTAGRRRAARRQRRRGDRSGLAGARIMRAHDVAATVDALKVAVALRAAGHPRRNDREQRNISARTACVDASASIR